MIDFDQNSMMGNGGGGVSVMAPMENNTRSRFRSRLQNKGGLVQPPSPGNDYLGASSPRSIYGIGELNRRITDLKVDNPALSPPQTFASETTPKLLDLGQNYPNNSGCHYQTSMIQYNQNINPQLRRDSNNSTTSSSYYSMKSCDVSRRSSQQSYTTSANTIRNNNFTNYDSQFYDPISAGNSRRSSQMSNNEMSNYGPPSSQLLTSHLARLQRQTAASSSNLNPYHTNYFNQNQYHPYSNNTLAAMCNNYNFAHFNQQMSTGLSLPSSDRRMSEPISNFSKSNENQNQNVNLRRPRSTTPTRSLETLLDETTVNDNREKSKGKDSKSPVKPHPNETVVLDVLKTNEKIENCDELVIPDEMVMYLNQVVDETTEMTNESKIKRDFEGDMQPLSSSISIEKIKEEDLFSLLADVEVKSEENAGVQLESEDLEINNNKDCKTESDKTSKPNSSTRQISCKS